LFLVSTEPIGIKQTDKQISVPGLGTVAREKAAYIFLFLYLAFGIFANAALRRAIDLAKEIKEIDVRIAAVKRLSFFTFDQRFLRVITTFFPALLMLVAFLIEKFRSGSAIDWTGLAGWILLSGPYIVLAGRLWDKMGSDTSSSKENLK
jgi:hypothetical protein